MKAVPCALVLLCAVLCAAVQTAAAAVFVVPVKGQVSEAQFFFLRRALKEAERAGAPAIVLDMDTLGGSLSAAVKMQEALFKTRVPTLTYIHPNAGSAGALIALSTRRIFMAPVSAIGAAAPVLAGGQDLPETMTDKIVSYYSGYFRSAASRNGHNPDIAEAFINKNKEVKLGETVLHEKGSVLTLSAQEATQSVSGKPVLAEGIAENLADLLQKAGLPADIHQVKATGFERAAFWITTLGPLFLLGGIVGAYLEFKTPGFGVPGIVAAVCFLIFFTGHYLAGLAGLEVFVLFAVGVLLVLSEVLLHPGTVLPGLLGAALMLLALLLAMVDRYPSEPWWPTADQLLGPVLKLSGTAAGAAVLIAILARFLPRTPLYGRLVLQATSPPGMALGPATRVLHVVAGDRGTAVTVLRPSGRASFGELTVDVVTQGDFIAPGTPVRVVAVEGTRVIVEAVA